MAGRAGKEGRAVSGGWGLWILSTCYPLCIICVRILRFTHLLCFLFSLSLFCTHTQLAESAIFSVSKLTPPPGVGEAAVQEIQWGQQLEEGQLHWALGETSLALQTLRDMTQQLEKVCMYVHKYVAALFSLTVCHLHFCVAVFFLIL